MKTIITAAAILAAAPTALGQDTKFFDGGYLGADVGYVSDNGIDGITYSGVAGWRRQTDSGLVYGLEGSFGSASANLGYDESISEDFYKTHWTATGVIGFAQDRNLLTLGAGYGQIKSSYSFGNGDITVTGKALVVAGGYERAIGDNLSLRAKVTSYEFNNFIGSVGIAMRF